MTEKCGKFNLLDKEGMLTALPYGFNVDDSVIVTIEILFIL